MEVSSGLALGDACPSSSLASRCPKLQHYHLAHIVPLHTSLLFLELFLSLECPSPLPLTYTSRIPIILQQTFLSSPYTQAGCPSLCIQGLCVLYCCIDYLAQCTETIGLYICISH